MRKNSEFDELRKDSAQVPEVIPTKRVLVHKDSKLPDHRSGKSVNGIFPVDFSAPNFKKRPKWFLSFFLCVICPTLIASMFLIFFITPRYTSEFRVSVRAAESNKAMNVAGLFGMAGTQSTTNDSHSVVQYVLSRALVEDLGPKLSLNNIFGSTSVDFISRLSDDAPIETKVKYWQGMVDAFFEPTTGTITVKIKAFFPKDAHMLALRVLELAEQLVNRLSARSREDMVKFAEEEVSRAEKRSIDINRRFRILRDTERTLDPRKSADSTMSLIGKINEEIFRLSTDLASQRNSLSSNAPSVIVNQGRLDALRKQLESAKALATSDPTSLERPLSVALGGFEQLESERVFAEKAYQSALVSLETARMDAAKQQIYLATIVRPGLPEDFSFPKLHRDLPIVFLALMSLWFIVLFSYHVVREHR